MKKQDVIRAWRDEDAFLALSDDDKASLPGHPAGITEIRDEDLRGVAGGIAAAGTHYSFCDPTASWCDDCGDGDIDILAAR